MAWFKREKKERLSDDKADVTDYLLGGFVSEIKFLDCVSEDGKSHNVVLTHARPAEWIGCVLTYTDRQGYISPFKVHKVKHCASIWEAEGGPK